MKEILVKDLVCILGGNTKILIINMGSEIYTNLWEGIIDDVDFDNIPYGEYEVKHATVINGEDILQIHIIV